MSLAADGEDGNGLQLEKLTWAKLFKLFPFVLKKINIDGLGLLSFCELRLYYQFGVHR